MLRFISKLTAASFLPLPQFPYNFTNSFVWIRLLPIFGAIKVTTE